MEYIFKFRAWDTKNDRMVYDSEDGYAYDIALKNASKDRYKLMPCVGIKDKNKKLIYKGDILNAPVDINQDRYGNRQYYVVGELDGQFILTVRYIPKLKLALPDGYQFGYLCRILNFGENGYEGDDIEIIGNIYENPKLLESEG